MSALLAEHISNLNQAIPALPTADQLTTSDCFREQTNRCMFLALLVPLPISLSCSHFVPPRVAPTPPSLSSFLPFLYPSSYTQKRMKPYPTPLEKLAPLQPKAQHHNIIHFFKCCCVSFSPKKETSGSRWAALHPATLSSRCVSYRRVYRATAVIATTTTAPPKKKDSTEKM